MNRVILTTLIAVFIFGCGNPEAEKVAALKKECIEIHDEVMPQWQDIASMSGELKKWSTALAEADSIDSIAQLKTQVNKSATLLDSAYDAMGDWMSNYEPDLDQSQSIDSALSYYKSEKERITAVNSLMKLSIENGKQILANRP
jgi:hypothetical protein